MKTKNPWVRKFYVYVVWRPMAGYTPDYTTWKPVGLFFDLFDASDNSKPGDEVIGYTFADAWSAGASKTKLHHVSSNLLDADRGVYEVQPTDGEQPVDTQ